VSTQANRFPLKVSNTVVRIVAAEVFVVALLALLLRSPWITLALALDFSIRALVTPLASPLRLVGSYAVLPLIRARDALVFFSPKRFAAMLGLSLTAVAFIALAASAYAVAAVALGILLLFSFLEAAFGFCAGCKIYGFLMRLGVIPESWCPECVSM